MRTRAVISHALVTFALSCGPTTQVDAREAEVATVLSRADDVMARTRPTLVAAKYARMASSPYDFYRGNLPVFRQDWELGRASRSAFVDGVDPVFGLADPHPENFGLLMAADESLALEPNDFDSADRVPYLFDLRRLIAGFVVGAKVANAEVDPVALGRAIATAYAQALSANTFDRFDAAATQNHDDIANDLFRRGARDRAAHAELDILTTVNNGQRRLIRGLIDPSEPTQSLADLPDFAQAALPALLQRLAPNRQSEKNHVLDAAREYGSGVASWPRVRLLVLLQGPTEALDDDVLVEVKELGESAMAGWYRPVLPAADSPSRVEGAARRAWFRSDADPRFFASEWLGLPVLVRTESEAQKNVRISRWSGNRSRAATLTSFATLLGQLLARVHGRSGPTAVNAIVGRVAANREAFAAEQGAFADTYSAQVFADFEAFKTALARLGPTLGVRGQQPVVDAPNNAVARLFGAQ